MKKKIKLQLQIVIKNSHTKKNKGSASWTYSIIETKSLKR